MDTEGVDYGGVMEGSLSMLKRHIILFFPNIVLILVSLMLFLIFFNTSGIADALADRPYLLEDPVALRSVVGSLSETSSFILSLAAFVIIELLMSAFFTVMKFGMIRDVIKKDKTSLKSGADFAEKNYFNFLTVYIATRAIIFIPLLVLLFIYMLVVRSSPSMYLGPFLLGLFGVVWLFYAIIMAIRLFFVYPVMTFERDRYFKVIGHDFHYVKTHITHTIISFLIILVVLFGYVYVRETVNLLGFEVQGFAVVLALTIFVGLLEILVTTWEHVFIFRSYSESRRIDKLLKKYTGKGKNTGKDKTKGSKNTKETSVKREKASAKSSKKKSKR